MRYHAEAQVGQPSQTVQHRSKHQQCVQYELNIQTEETCKSAYLSLASASASLSFCFSFLRFCFLSASLSLPLPLPLLLLLLVLIDGLCLRFFVASLSFVRSVPLSLSFVLSTDLDLDLDLFLCLFTGDLREGFFRSLDSDLLRSLDGDLLRSLETDLFLSRETDLLQSREADLLLSRLRSLLCGLSSLLDFSFLLEVLSTLSDLLDLSACLLLRCLSASLSRLSLLSTSTRRSYRAHSTPFASALLGQTMACSSNRWSRSCVMVSVQQRTWCYRRQVRLR